MPAIERMCVWFFFSTDVCGMWFWSLSFDNVELYLKTDKWCTYISITQSYGTVGIGSGCAGGTGMAVAMHLHYVK